jgi:hypothetical protein
LIYFIFENLWTENHIPVHDFVIKNAVKLTYKHLACKKISGAKLPDPRRTEKRGKGNGRERMERGGIGLYHFSDQSYAPAGKHTSNNRSTTRSTTVLLIVVLNVVCRVQIVTSYQQEQ